MSDEPTIKERLARLVALNDVIAELQRLEAEVHELRRLVTREVVWQQPMKKAARR